MQLYLVWVLAISSKYLYYGRTQRPQLRLRPQSAGCCKHRREAIPAQKGLDYLRNCPFTHVAIHQLPLIRELLLTVLTVEYLAASGRISSAKAPVSATCPQES